MKQAIIQKIPLLLAVGLALLLVPVINQYTAQPQLETILAHNELRVATRLSPTTYYVEEEQPGGFEYDLALAYADYLGVELKLEPMASIKQITEALRLNNVHLAAAGLARTRKRAERFDFGPTYLESPIQLIYRSGTNGNGVAQKAPTSLHQIDSQIVVAADSTHAEYLQQTDPAPPWQEAEPGVEALDLLTSVDNKQISYTLADAEAFNVSSAFFPRLRAAFELPEPQQVAWMLKQSADSSLQQSLYEFFSLPATQDLLQDLKERHFETDQRLNFVDNLTFRHHLKTRLPQLEQWFRQAGEEYSTEWELVAAIGYQESHWNPRATSPTGVRGVMMLTQPTARAMGIKKRTDARQSIFGGARYFQKLLSRIPQRITDENRFWLALAAYNVGRGHLEDARILTQRAGGNPDNWDDVAQSLPKLAQARWYKTVKHGYARGYEPVRYVANIKRYWTMLKLESRYQAIQSMAEEPGIMGPPEPQPLHKLPSTL